jgi:hypothetical protein
MKQANLVDDLLSDYVSDVMTTTTKGSKKKRGKDLENMTANTFDVFQLLI